ncbi:DnaT-like ssDNA-binding domain-containing protein [Umboniibacter marinipuniceus]|uniref:DnaT DNA-binding domain-containing protein n=1 Tax=Umboniibacter marinipuniceus TaxID=569599 RepID=A0A3M0ABT9_9GAMM|nr:DnaT-like ssDNA-binding domain-containing protein [Umboniibacter marinipuniceus]RMA82370.1 hypothetical protein DFR27_0319 [Umboniibacter marinipuniceus]
MTALLTNSTISVARELAVKYGLEEAVLLSHLNEAVIIRGVKGKDGHAWVKLEGPRLLKLFPFWNTQDLQRIIQSLNNQSAIIVASPPVSESNELIYRLIPQQLSASVEQRMAPVTQAIARPTPTQFNAASPMAPNWQPSEDDMRTLTQFGVSREFALEQLTEFVSYWRERGTAHNAWGSKFAAQVRRKWREHQQDEAESARKQPLNEGWIPGDDVTNILLRDGVPQSFIDDCVPEFKLYWRERGDSSSTWDSKFLQHIRRQWQSYSHNIKHDTNPQPIAPNWQPDRDVIDILAMANIPADFAASVVGEFVLYWRESQQLHRSWNSKFLQHVKHRWAQRHQQGVVSTTGDNHGNRATRDLSTGELVQDRSWAN